MCNKNIYYPYTYRMNYSFFSFPSQLTNEVQKLAYSTKSENATFSIQIKTKKYYIASKNIFFFCRYINILSSKYYAKFK